MQNEIIAQHLLLIVFPRHVEICPPPQLKLRQFAAIPNIVGPAICKKNGFKNATNVPYFLE